MIGKNILLLGVLMALTPAPTPAQGSAPVVGVGSHQLDVRSIAELRDLGVSYVRTTLYLHQFHDPAEWAEFRKGLDRAVAAGMEPLVVIHEPVASVVQASRRPAMWAEVTAAAVEVARLYPTASVQLWNEPDTPSFTDAFGSFSGLPMRERGRLYGEMLRTAYAAIKRANPRTRVVTAGLSTGGGDLRDFLSGMGNAPFDVLALHTYGLPVLRAARDKAAIARAYTNKPLWDTEFGLEEAVIPALWSHARQDVDGFQLQAMRETVEWNDRTRSYERMYWHVLRQNGDKGYDLIRADRSLRPSAQWLRARNRAGRAPAD